MAEDQKHPERCKTSCSDDNPTIAKPNAAGCIRCDVLMSREYEEFLQEVQVLRSLSEEYNDLIHHMSTGGDFHEFYRDRFAMEQKT